MIVTNPVYRLKYFPKILKSTLVMQKENIPFRQRGLCNLAIHKTTNRRATENQQIHLMSDSQAALKGTIKSDNNVYASTGLH